MSTVTVTMESAASSEVSEASSVARPEVAAAPVDDKDDFVEWGPPWPFGKLEKDRFGRVRDEVALASP